MIQDAQHDKHNHDREERRMIRASSLSRHARFILLRVVYGIALAVCTLIGPAGAQTDVAHYPDRPVLIIVPYPPGGGTDILARVLADKLQARLNQPVVVENRPGASGNVGSEAVFRAKPDGYTLLFSAQPPLVANESLYTKLNFDPDALVSVSVAAAANIVLLVNSKVPVNTLQQFIDYARANPGKLNYASQGIGSSGHLTGELFSMMAGVKMTHVPYAGTNPAVTDLIAGHVDLMFGEMATGGPYLPDGRLKLLGLGGDKRFSAYPDIPTISEALPGFFAKVWQGMVAPPGTPDAITGKLSVAINDVLKMPDVTDRLDKWYMTAVGGAPEDMDRFLKAERERWGNVIRASGTKIE
jgi:tripartite-type tricarboxylate transporter receptor subunit TctC